MSVNHLFYCTQLKSVFNCWLSTVLCFRRMQWPEAKCFLSSSRVHQSIFHASVRTSVVYIINTLSWKSRLIIKSFTQTYCNNALYETKTNASKSGIERSKFKATVEWHFDGGSIQYSTSHVELRVSFLLSRFSHLYITSTFGFNSCPSLFFFHFDWRNAVMS